MTGKIVRIATPLMAGLFFWQAAGAAPVPYGLGADTFHPMKEPHGMVASVDATATQVGVEILRQGETQWMLPLPWAMHWQSPIPRPGTLVVVAL